MGRKLVVRVVAWGLRRGIDANTMEQAMRKRFPHRDSAWRLAVIEHAGFHNGRRQRVRAS